MAHGVHPRVSGGNVRWLRETRGTIPTVYGWLIKWAITRNYSRR